MKYITLTLLLFSNYLVFGQSSTGIRLNQVGFYTYGPKSAAIINSTATTFTVRAENGDSIYGGILSAAKTWNLSGESIKQADFTAFHLPGKYYLTVQDLDKSFTFQIQEKVLSHLNKALIKAFYYNRTSTALPLQYAGKWARATGHPDKNVVVHPSAASSLRPAGTIISSPKGWYDAGDYNSYIVNSGISTYSLLISYEHFKPYYDTLQLNIPETGNILPDILDEIKWNLDWMLTMQDPNDGGVYFKKTNANFDGSVMPSSATNTRYVVKKSTTSALDFAAVMAVAYRLYSPHLPTFADSCLQAAIKAYDWGLANPNVSFTNPGAQAGYPAVSTGGYGDSNFTDELEWASNELYIATKDETFYGRGFKNANAYSLPDWPNVRTLGLLSLLYNRKSLTSKALLDTVNMKNKLLTLANGYVSYQKSTSPYKIVMGQSNGNFSWGSNSFAANQAMLLMNAYFLTNEIEYASAAVAQVDYLVGRNATGYSFVTGIGSKSSKNIHHRPSEADGIVEPVPGWLAGGPTGSSGDGCPFSTTLLAKSYTDSIPCYTKNEVAINWNAPAVYITGALEYFGVFNEENELSVSLNEEGYASLFSMHTYPVPSNEEVTVSLNSKVGSASVLHLIDALGVDHYQKQWMLTSGENQIVIDVRGLTPGVYFLTVDVQNATFKGKVIVSRR